MALLNKVKVNERNMSVFISIFHLADKRELYEVSAFESRAGFYFCSQMTNERGVLGVLCQILMQTFTDKSAYYAFNSCFHDRSLNSDLSVVVCFLLVRYEHILLFRCWELWQ